VEILIVTCLHRVLIGAALMSSGLCAAQTEDSLRATDTLRAIRDATAFGADSTAMLADSLTAGTGVADQWLWPAAIIVLSITAVYLLFTVRSK